MRGRRLLFVKLVFIFLERSSGSSKCDKETRVLVEEGNIGRTPYFSWLGMLKVYLNDGDNMNVAVTGIVLIKPKHVIANADDVVRIPKNLFAVETKVMFLGDGPSPWYFTPVSYVTHPDYEMSTFNSIAIIQLNVGDPRENPLKPICLSTVANYYNFLYLTGFTDEHKVLEKEFYKIQHLEQKVCRHFYKKAGLSDKGLEPTQFLCGISTNKSTDCVWENGMVLMTNVTGWFTLIGLSVQGPGCAAPARFINIFPYLTWIEKVTATGDDYSDESSDFKKQNYEFVPIHDMFRANSSYRRDDDLPFGDPEATYVKYPFGSKRLRYFNIEDTGNNVLSIYPFNVTWELYAKSCHSARTLMYRELFRLNAPKESWGTVTYKLSLFDLINQVCVCVQLNVECTNRSDAILYFKEHIILETEADTKETPEEILQIFSKPTRDKKPRLRPEFIHDLDPIIKSTMNYELYIRFDFEEEAKLTFEMYTTPPAPDKTTSTTTEFVIPKRRAEEVTTQSSTKPKVPRYWDKPQHEGMPLAYHLNRVKEPVISFVAQDEVVQATVSEGCRRELHAVYIHLVLIIVLRRAFFT